MTARYENVATLLLKWFCSILSFAHKINHFAGTHPIFHVGSIFNFSTVIMIIVFIVLLRKEKEKEKEREREREKRDKRS